MYPLNVRHVSPQAAVAQTNDLTHLLDQKESAYTTVTAQCVALQAETDMATSRLNTLAKRMTVESEQAALAVQKAIQSSVRLCVVAPTVNVHVADKKMKFRSKYVCMSMCV